MTSFEGQDDLMIENYADTASSMNRQRNRERHLMAIKHKSKFKIQEGISGSALLVMKMGGSKFLSFH